MQIRRMRLYTNVEKSATLCGMNLIAAGAYIEGLRKHPEKETIGLRLSRARLADMVGTTGNTLYRIESGKQEPKGNLLSRLIDTLGGDVDDFRELASSKSATKADGYARAERRFSEGQVKRIDRIIEETPEDELDVIFDEMRAESRKRPSLVSHVRTFWAGLRAGGGDSR